MSHRVELSLKPKEPLPLNSFEYLDELSDDILLKILEHVNLLERFITVFHVSKRFHQLTTHRSLFRNYLLVLHWQRPENPLTPRYRTRIPPKNIFRLEETRKPNGVQTVRATEGFLGLDLIPSWRDSIETKTHPENSNILQVNVYLSGNVAAQTFVQKYMKFFGALMIKNHAAFNRFNQMTSEVDPTCIESLKFVILSIIGRDTYVIQPALSLNAICLCLVFSEPVRPGIHPWDICLTPSCRILMLMKHVTRTLTSLRGSFMQSAPHLQVLCLRLIPNMTPFFLQQILSACRNLQHLTLKAIDYDISSPTSSSPTEAQRRFELEMPSTLISLHLCRGWNGFISAGVIELIPLFSRCTQMRHLEIYLRNFDEARCLNQCVRLSALENLFLYRPKASAFFRNILEDAPSQGLFSDFHVSLPPSCTVYVARSDAEKWKVYVDAFRWVEMKKAKLQDVCNDVWWEVVRTFLDDDWFHRAYQFEFLKFFCCTWFGNFWTIKGSHQKWMRLAWERET